LFFKEQAVMELDTIEERRKLDREKYEEFRNKKREYGWFKPRCVPVSNGLKSGMATAVHGALF
jgi:hypothetical protein